MNIKDYGYISGIAGVFSGVAGTAFSVMLTFCIKRFEYYRTMSVFFSVGFVMFVISAISAIMFKTIPPTVKSEKSEKVNIFRYKPFYVLLMPNLLRGFCTGILFFATIIGNHCKMLDASAGSICTALVCVSTLLGSYTYSRLSLRVKNGNIILISGILSVLSMPAMVIGKNTFVFYTMFFISLLCMNAVPGLAVPAAVTEFVSYNYIGRYSAWRMVLHTGGVTLSGIVLSPLLNTCGAFGTLAIAALAQLLAGIVYYIYIKKHT